MSLTIIHLENSRSDRLVWLLEELGVDYAIETHQRDPKTGRAGADLGKLHPYAKAPMLRDGERMLIESGAIFEYVVGRYGDGGLRPDPADEDWPDYLQWMHFAEGSAMLPILLDHFQAAGLAGPPGESMLAAMAKDGMAQLYAYMESVLAEREWFAGPRFTAADVMMGWVVEVVDNRGEIGPYPAMQRYLERIKSRPAYQRAKERAGDGG
ncbi:MAG: glutathione S-transferase family protein [bacterium]|nr:glutathione S-transferase family protein [bacterium]